MNVASFAEFLGILDMLPCHHLVAIEINVLVHYSERPLTEMFHIGILTILQEFLKHLTAGIFWDVLFDSG